MQASNPLLSVKVLLSTYNGERYLDTQLESLAQQRQVRVDLEVRDDGSNDSTLAILNKWREQMPIKVSAAQNKGAIASFLELIYTAELNAEYYAFCDQDDYWLPDKLASAVQQLSALDGSKPLLYCSAQSVTDENLNIKFVSRPPRHPVGFGNALVQNVATGCTVVVNRALMDAVRSRRVEPSQIIMHDWWLLLIAAGLGEVIFDPVPRILYRQHGKNEVGHASGLRFWRTRLKRFASRRKTGMLSVQANAFLDLFGSQLSESKRSLVESCLSPERSIFSAFGCVSSNKLYRQSTIDNWILRLLFLLRRV